MDKINFKVILKDKFAGDAEYEYSVNTMEELEKIVDEWFIKSKIMPLSTTCYAIDSTCNYCRQIH